MLIRILGVIVWLMGVAVPLGAIADNFPEPEGPVILTITPSAGAEPIQFDRAMLEGLAWQTITTHTSFTEGPQAFSGVPLASLLDAVQAQGEMIRATALNDYAVDIPFGHATEHGVFLALDHNGKPMRVRDKGPIWIVYPRGPTDETNGLDALMVWQLRSLAVGG